MAPFVVNSGLYVCNNALVPHTIALYPGLLKLGEEKAWYTLFAHARQLK